LNGAKPFRYLTCPFRSFKYPNPVVSVHTVINKARLSLEMSMAYSMHRSASQADSYPPIVRPLSSISRSQPYWYYLSTNVSRVFLMPNMIISRHVSMRHWVSAFGSSASFWLLSLQICIWWMGTS
jgi:hypothetical protein